MGGSALQDLIWEPSKRSTEALPKGGCFLGCPRGFLVNPRLTCMLLHPTHVCTFGNGHFKGASKVPGFEGPFLAPKEDPKSRTKTGPHAVSLAVG